MDVVTISNVKQDVVEFDVDVQGIADADMITRFVIETQVADVGIAAARKESSSTKWVVEVPPLPFIERTAYPFRIEIIVDGYYFTPMRGTVNVVGSTDVYATTPVNTTLSAQGTTPEEPSPERTPSSSSIELKLEKKSEKKPKKDKFNFLKDREEDLSESESIANKILNDHADQDLKPKPKSTKKMDEAVKQIIQSTTPTNRTKKPSFKKGKVITK